MSSESRRQEPQGNSFDGQGLRLLAGLIARAHRAKLGLDPKVSLEEQPEENDPQPEGLGRLRAQRGKRMDP